MNDPAAWTERVRLKQAAMRLAFGAVIRYHGRWLIVLFIGACIYLAARDFVQWAFPPSPLVTLLLGGFHAVVAICLTAIVVMLGLKLDKLGNRIASRACLTCGYPMPPGVGQRCPECGKFAEIALPPD